MSDAAPRGTTAAAPRTHVQKAALVVGVVFLHLVLGLGMIALGAVLTRRSTSGSAATV